MVILDVFLVPFFYVRFFLLFFEVAEALIALIHPHLIRYFCLSGFICFWLSAASSLWSDFSPLIFKIANALGTFGLINLCLMTFF